MATNYNITMKQFNGTDYDNLYPAANLANSIGTLGVAHGGTGVTSISALQTQLGLDQYAKIQTGSYTGTGTYGSSNPNSLTFNFDARLCFVSQGYYNCLFDLKLNFSQGRTYIINTDLYKSRTVSDYFLMIVGTEIYRISGNLLSWYVSFGVNYSCFILEANLETKTLSIDTEGLPSFATMQLNDNTSVYNYLII